jgi:hypothetical protein
MQARPDKVEKSRHPGSGGWFARPAVLSACLPDGQPKLSSVAMLCLDLSGWGRLSIVAGSGALALKSRSRFGPGQKRVTVIVPSGTTIEVRYANLWGAHVVRVDVERPEALLTTAQLHAPGPVVIGQMRLLPGFTSTSLRAVAQRPRQMHFRIRPRMRALLASVMPPSVRAETPSVSPARMQTSVRALPLRLGIPSEWVIMSTHVAASTSSSVTDLPKEGITS